MIIAWLNILFRIRNRCINRTKRNQLSSYTSMFSFSNGNHMLIIFSVDCRVTVVLVTILAATSSNAIVDE